MSAESLACSLALHRADREFTGTCPACNYQGFAITEKQRRTLFHCHAGGCTQADVIEELWGPGRWPREVDECRRPFHDKWPARRA
jgi:hypothetical protein